MSALPRVVMPARPVLRIAAVDDAEPILPDGWELTPDPEAVWKHGTGALHNREAEQVVIGGLMRGVIGVSLILNADDLYWASHRLAWGHLLAAWESSQGEYGPWTLCRRLTLTREVDEFGGLVGFARWVGDCYDLDPTGCWAVPAARLVVRPLADRRRVIQKAKELIRDAAAGCYAPGEYAGQVELLELT